ncbi:MAG: PaaI family thioesterase [Flavobacteriaceae bacterium]
MALRPATINRFLFFKLPAAWWCGVRVHKFFPDRAQVRVRFKWINQNPFRSMFWAVQGMAAELATGVYLIDILSDKTKSISTLLVGTKAEFTKKAVGQITFECVQGQEIHALVDRALASGKGEQLWVDAIGTDETGDVVAKFSFQWSVKKKSKK